MLNINVNYSNNMSLNNLVDNIIQIARNNNVTESEHLSRRLIELWIKYYRAMLIKLAIDRGDEIDEEYITTIGPIHLDAEETAPGNIVYVGDKELPTLIGFKNRPGVVSVMDMYGNLIQLGSHTKAKYLKYRKATCADYIACVKNNKIYVEGGANQLEYIQVDVIAEDPTENRACFNPDSKYPIPTHMVPTLVNLILTRELNVMVVMPSDETNNSKDDNQNKYSKR